ncbi:uncharacterized protein LOC114442870 [Parambassis ranga]|uniref:Uncharacterized protein LOC114442870 n=1 Tax=Parambassis ranga TaxID=210632 RepID=A0A6P7J6U2_9TELE|nr:uncharacterized protein LOC114442870 [Parambassis ranga]
MRPRSRLLSKRGLMLPTIREGTEETVRELNEANTLHIAGHSQAVSSEDYLLSICHLAHPTREVFPNSFHTQQQDAVQQRLRPPRLSGPALTTFEFNPKEGVHGTDAQQGEEEEKSGGLMFANSDPLEYLYGHQNNLCGLSGGMREACVKGRQHGIFWEGPARTRAHSIPCASRSDLPRQRKSSIPELHSSSNASVPNISPQLSFSLSETRRILPVDEGAEGERLNPTIKQSLISQWISDCRSVWREARVRACMLPAIAEV